MRFVVFVCLAIVTLGRPVLAQSAPSPAPVPALEDGISVTGAGRVANFTRHVLVFSSTQPNGGFGGGGMGGGGFGGGRGISSAQIDSEVHAKQTALVAALEKLKLGRIETVPEGETRAIDGSIFGYQAPSGSVLVHLFQKACDGETIGGIKKNVLIDIAKKETGNASMVLISFLESSDSAKNYRVATTQAIANGRASADTIASAAAVKVNKLVAAREGNSYTTSSARLMILTRDGATISQPGGLSVVYALRFSIR